MGTTVLEIAGGPHRPPTPTGKRCGYQKEWLKASKFDHIFIHIHSDKSVPLIVCHFNTYFFERGDFKVSYLRVVGLLGGKFTLFQIPLDNQIFRSLRLSAFINVVLLLNVSKKY